MSGRRHRQKGDRVERQLVELHRSIGVSARRVPLSGAQQGYPGDIVIDLEGEPLIAESKARANGSGFVTLERWLGKLDALFLKRDRQEPLVVLPWRTYLRLIAKATDADGGQP